VADAAPPEPPAAPSNARIEDFIEECGDPSASYTVAWDDNSDNELGFEVWRDVGGTGFELYATVGPNVTSIDEIFPPGSWGGIVYDYKVLAIGDPTSSDFSNTATAVGGCG
jgi:hypothetical protein